PCWSMGSSLSRMPVTPGPPPGPYCAVRPTARSADRVVALPLAVSLPNGKNPGKIFWGLLGIEKLCAIIGLEKEFGHKRRRGREPAGKAKASGCRPPLALHYHVDNYRIDNSSVLPYRAKLSRDKRAAPRHRAGDGIVEMLEAEGEPLLRARRVKVDTGDLT